jgi:hypothetical protein
MIAIDDRNVDQLHRYSHVNGIKVTEETPLQALATSWLGRFATWGIPHSVTTFKIGSLQATEYQTQF